jgi:hypothetical protein
MLARLLRQVEIRRHPVARQTLDATISMECVGASSRPVIFGFSGPE